MQIDRIFNITRVNPGISKVEICKLIGIDPCPADEDTAIKVYLEIYAKGRAEMYKQILSDLNEKETNQKHSG